MQRPAEKPGIVKGRSPLTLFRTRRRTPERMKTIWLLRVAAFAAREQSERQTLRQLERVAVCHFSDTQKSRMMRLSSCIVT